MHWMARTLCSLPFSLRVLQARDMDFMQQLAGQTLDGISVLSRRQGLVSAWHNSFLPAATMSRKFPELLICDDVH